MEHSVCNSSFMFQCIFSRSYCCTRYDRLLPRYCRLLSVHLSVCLSVAKRVVAVRVGLV